MPRFEYHDPDELDEVLSLLAEHGDEAKVIAGGQSLLPLLATRLAQPAHLVDVTRVVGLRSVQDRGDHVAFGATTSERDAEQSAIVQERVPLLAEALPFIGHVAIRNRGTIAGSLAHADPSAEIPAVAVALGAEVVVRSVRGERILQAEDLFRGYLTTSLDDDEVIVEVRLPTAPPATGWCFQEVARRHGDFALVGAAVHVAVGVDGDVTHAGIVLCGVGDTPVRADRAERVLIGARPSTEAIAEASELASGGLDPISDFHGSGVYRKHLAAVIVRRALTTAVSRAGGVS